MDQPFEVTDQAGALSEWIRGVGTDSHLKGQIQWAYGDQAVGTLEVSWHHPRDEDGSRTDQRCVDNLEVLMVEREG